jgi:pimeloyl-ACP methyl ester carboxylesterase
VRRVPTTDGLSLAVHEHRAGSRPALLCHATGFHGGVWDPLVDELGDTLSAVALDFRGHGSSTVPEGTALGWDGTADDVLAVVEACSLPEGEVVGVGHSMGGAALLLAELRRPGTFAGLWLFEPIVIPPEVAQGAGPNPLAEGARRRRARFGSAAEALDNFASKPPFNVLRADALYAYVRHGFTEQPDGSVQLACRPEDEARIYEGGSRHGAWDGLPEIDPPVVVSHGEDGLGPAAFAPLISARIPGAQLEQVPHVGHFGPLEAPAAVAASIRRFLAGMERRAR